ncbi:MAG: RusA family crossover junction endodeoxyribonuclease [Actinomycetota bacterium]|nr:RusA family crossover junction endodeoxyribonuclease [Actinomycetota bacterium]
MFRIVLNTPPTPASRPRVGRWGVYYTPTYKAYRKAAHAAIPACTQQPLKGELYAIMEFVCHRPKTTKRCTPLGDIDNHVKSILDAVVGEKKNRHGYIVDDDQIARLTATKRWVEEGETPHTIITIGVL